MGDVAMGELSLEDGQEPSVKSSLLGADYYARLKETGSYSTWDHFTNRGHTGKVLCVASSDAADYIVSGGEDYTMRVWGYDSSKSANVVGSTSLSYDLIAVLMHDDEYQADLKEYSSEVMQVKRPSLWCPSWLQPATVAEEGSDVVRGVTAVCCLGSRGPFLSGSARGDVFVFFLGAGDTEGSVIPQVGLHSERINAIAAPSGLGAVGEESAWHFVAASEDGIASVLRFRGSSTDCQLVRLQHNGQPVRGARCLEGGGEDDASIATHSATAVFIWNIQGECLLRFHEFPNAQGASMAAPPVIGSIAVANKESGTLVFVSIQETVSVWGFEHGKLCGPHGECPPPAPYDSAPLVTYKDHALSFDVDQSRQSTEFLVDLRDEFTCGVWNLKGVEAGYLAIEPRGPAALLAAAGRKFMHLDLRHAARVTQIRVAEDLQRAQGPCLIAACGDGSVLLWDLEGVDSGEVYAELRSLRVREILLPIVLLLVSFFQVMSFAFGPAIKWRDEVRRPAYFTQKIVWGELDFVLRVPRDVIFIPIISGVVCLMFSFLVFAATGMPDLLKRCIYCTQSTNDYKRESKAGTQGLRILFAKMHLLKAAFEITRSLVGLTMLACSTIFVAPVFKHCAQALHCVPHPTADDPHPEGFLAVAPQVPCYEGLHLWLAWAIRVLAPFYFLALIPYAVVEGDVNYMKWRKFFFPKSYWAASALRKATVVSLGPLHPNPDTTFRTLLGDLTAKASLPVIEALFTHMPRLQMLLITAVGLAMYVSSLCWPAKMDRMFCCLVQNTRLFTLCAMLCGCLTVALPTGSVIPVVLLAVCALLVPIMTVRSIMQSPLQPPAVQRCTTTSVIEADYNDEMAAAGSDVSKVEFAAEDYRNNHTLRTSELSRNEDYRNNQTLSASELGRNNQTVSASELGRDNQTLSASELGRDNATNEGSQPLGQGGLVGLQPQRGHQYTRRAKGIKGVVKQLEIRLF